MTVKFDFKKGDLTLTDEQIEESMSKPSGGKFLRQGIHEVKIVEADYAYKDGNCMCINDPTWAKIKLVLEDAGNKQINHWLIIPTTPKITYGDGSSKRPEFMFVKFREFMAAMGETVLADKKVLQTIIPKYFAKPTVLVGKKLTIDVGYRGPYLNFVSKGVIQICKPDGSLVVSDSFETKEEATVKAVELKLKLQDFPEILKFIGKEAPAEVGESDMAEDEGW